MPSYSLTIHSVTFLVKLPHSLIVIIQQVVPELNPSLRESDSILDKGKGSILRRTS